MRTRTLASSALLWALVLGVALPGCKKPPESEPPDEAGETGDTSAGDVGDDDDDEEEGGDPLSFEDFQETADYRTHTVVDCYTTQFAEQKDAPTGKLIVQITIAGDGGVTNVEIDPNGDLKDETLQKCALEQIHSWKFDETGSSKEVVHPHTFDFRPGELLK